MFSDVQIVNLGLSKIGQSRIERIDPPRTSNERFVAEGYQHWKRSELAKRRWVFTIEMNYKLTITEVLDDVERPYVYKLPTECLRPIRDKRTEWVQSRRNLHSSNDELYIDYVANVDSVEFDPLFVEVLACRVALECVEYITQSNSKKAEADAAYRDAVAEAARSNAFTIGPEDIQADDNDFAFLTGRY